MKQKKYKWKYWHIITSVNKKYQKLNPEIKVGVGVGRKDKHPYGVCILDIKKKVSYQPAYTLKYIGRLDWNASIEEICKLFKRP